MRIGQVIGERVRAQREERGWTQAQLGERIGSYLGQEWTRQAISGAEKGKRVFTAAELVAFANVLEVSISYLMMPPPGVETIELAPGIERNSVVVAQATVPFRGPASVEDKFKETGLRFFQRLADLADLMKLIQADMEVFVTDLRAVHVAQEEQKQ